MSKDYKVVSVKRWGGAIQGKPDPEGYFMHSLTLEGHTEEPIDYKSKTLPKEGDTLHGELVPYVSNAGNARTRLETPEYQKKENLVQTTIVAQFALRLAVEHATNHADEQEVLDLARYFIKCVSKLVEEQ